MTVHFIGAGPGAADLITLRGLKLIQSCPVCLYAGSLVPEGKVLESGHLYLGHPARRVRKLTAEEIAYFSYSAQHYVALARTYR